jgi:hypothetical protein
LIAIKKHCTRRIVPVGSRASRGEPDHELRDDGGGRGRGHAAVAKRGPRG